MWLVAHNRCWTADHLARRGSLTLNVVLFVTKHQRWLILSLLDAPLQGNFGFDSSHKLAYKLSPPSLQILLFMTGGEGFSSDRNGLLLHGLNSLIFLEAWTIWTQQNRCLFDGVVPDMARVLALSSEERKLWSIVGARGISFLISPTLVD
jgi:hypothetical protein